MNSYKIQVFGWESVFHTYQVDKEGVKVINQILKDNETQDLSEVWEEIEYELDLIGKEQLSICRPNLNLERLSFIVYDADGEEDNYFFGEDILEHTDIDPNYSSDHDYHVVEPKEMGGAVIVVPVRECRPLTNSGQILTAAVGKSGGKCCRISRILGVAAV